MRSLYLVSHTHWDREWYLPFQQFRLKLVLLIDRLLNVLEAEPAYKYFMLDGQTIVLDDYLEMRPGNAAKLAGYIRSGRILIGPWHILPDEFLVSPEATVRNLLQGERTCRHFGAKMPIGYIPDPFGHIGQMPQILRGFELDQAVFRRGLASEPCELWWQAPDGSHVFTAYLRDSYDNAAWLPMDNLQQFVSEVGRLADSLAAHSASTHLLLMHGTDHQMPHAKTGAVIDAAQPSLGEDCLQHATLPQYLEAVRSEIESSAAPIPVVIGELRSPQRHHLLPGVLSTRMWIKQRNHLAELELEKWIEPFSAWAGLLAENISIPDAECLRVPSEIIRKIWRMLMENHPHDSICGCSVDQVHEEMRCRFDQVDQAASQISQQSLNTIAGLVDTNSSAPEGAKLAVVVFNPTQEQRSDLVEFEMLLPAGCDPFEFVTEHGQRLAYSAVRQPAEPVLTLDLDRAGMEALLLQSSEGKIGGYFLMDCASRKQEGQLHLDVVLSGQQPPNLQRLQAIEAELREFLGEPEIETYHISARTAEKVLIRMLADNVPGCGFRTFWLCASAEQSMHSGSPEAVLENEYLRLELDKQSGTFTLSDKRTGSHFTGLNEFLDGGDAGDEYNYSPPEDDLLVSSRQDVPTDWTVARQPEMDSLTVRMVMLVPEQLNENRSARSQMRAPLRITTTASLIPGGKGVRFHTRVNNQASDHRLRVHFPFPAKVKTADYDGHFEVVQRSTSLPGFDESWIEQPRPEAPQRRFTSLSDGELGLMLANRGLPEVSVNQVGEKSSEIALTLLRCVGWLSRDDFPTRRGHAGPMLPTPGAQMQGEFAFDYALIPHRGDWSAVHGEAEAFNVPLRAVTAQVKAGILRCETALMRIDVPEFVLSAIKPPEDDDKGLIVRGYNITNHPILVHFQPGMQFTRVCMVNLLEQPQEPLRLNHDGSLDLYVPAHKIITLRWE